MGIIIHISFWQHFQTYFKTFNSLSSLARHSAILGTQKPKQPKQYPHLPHSELQSTPLRRLQVVSIIPLFHYNPPVFLPSCLSDKSRPAFNKYPHMSCMYCYLDVTKGLPASWLGPMFTSLLSPERFPSSGTEGSLVFKLRKENWSSLGFCPSTVNITTYQQ